MRLRVATQAGRHGAAWRRAVAGTAAVAAVVVLTACVTDRSADLVSSGGVCGAAAEMTEVLIDTRGEPDRNGDLVLAVDGLSSAAAARPDTTPPIPAEPLGELRSLGDRGADLSAAERDRWFEALGRLDGAVADRCGFSMRVLVAASRAETPVEGDDGIVESGAVVGADVEGGPLTWSVILDRLADADWTGRGYHGIVGVDPGVHVNVYDVPTESEALLVCADVLAALAPEAETTPVSVEVRGLADHPLAKSRTGTCVPAAEL